MPLEVQGHAIPQFKADVSGKCEPRGPRRCSTLILCQAIFKNPVLLQTEGLAPFVLISTVCNSLNLNFLEIRYSHYLRYMINNLQDWSRNMPIQLNVQF